MGPHTRICLYVPCQWVGDRVFHPTASLGITDIKGIVYKLCGIQPLNLGQIGAFAFWQGTVDGVETVAIKYKNVGSRSMNGPFLSSANADFASPKPTLLM